MKNKTGSTGWIAFIILLILILLGIGAYFLIASGTVEKAVDPCEREFDACNRACGEGIFNSICKEGCSYDYRNCKYG